MSDAIEVDDLHVEVEGEEILHGVNMKIERGKMQAIMGPNGSGKSTLAYAIMGHPAYEVTEGSITYKGKNVLDLSPDKRAKLGIFLGFQYPSDVTGVTVSNFLRTAHTALHDEELAMPRFQRKLRKKMDALNIDHSFADRYINDGFSGGEKKRVEVLQALMLEPEIAIFDEADSGLDIDALKLVANGINNLKESGTGVLLITHYERILEYAKPDKVHVMIDGNIVETGGFDLARNVEEEGYENLT